MPITTGSFPKALKGGKKKKVKKPTFVKPGKKKKKATGDPKEVLNRLLK